MRTFLVIALVLTLGGGCKKALQKLEEDTQIQPGENPQGGLHATGIVTNPGQVLNGSPNPTKVQPGQVQPRPMTNNKNNQPQPMNKQVSPQPMPMPMGNIQNVQGGSGGAVQAVRGAVNRVVTQNELKGLHLFIEAFSGANGQMPPPQMVFDALRKEDPKTAALVQDGAIVLTGIRQREGVWAYDKNALTNGGFAVTQNGVERLEAAQLRQMLMGQ